MRRLSSLLLLAAISLPRLFPVWAAPPRPEDIPKVEPVTLGLAGEPKPDILRYLYVQTADRGGNEREAFYLISPDGTKERELLPPSESFRQFGGFSPDGTRRDLTWVETPEHDVEQVALDRGGRYLAWTTTWSSLAGLDPESFVVPEAVDFPASDGVMLHGLLYLPKGATKPPLPPILLGVHGGPSAQARPGFSQVFQYLLSRGIAVFDLNFRGSTGFGKTFSRLDNGRLRPNAVRDMAEALDFLKKDGRVDASRAAVMGGSYGGYMTFAALTAFPDRFRSGVSFVGVSNWVTALQGASPQLKRATGSSTATSTTRRRRRPWHPQAAQPRRRLSPGGGVPGKDAPSLHRKESRS